MANTLVVNFTFNCPTIKVIGPVKDSTIEKLNSVLPSVTTSRRSERAGHPKFTLKSSPQHWTVTLDGQFCDQIGESRIMLAILDALEEEGTWKLATSHATTLPDTEALQQNSYNTYYFFFKRMI